MKYMKKPEPGKDFYLPKRPTLPQVGALLNLQNMARVRWGKSIINGNSDKWIDAMENIYGDEAASIYGLPDWRESAPGFPSTDLEAMLFLYDLWAANHGYIGPGR